LTVTGTVYALIDPRDGKPWYIGQTKKQPFTERLAGGYAPCVRSWLAELRKAGQKPQMVAVREGVPAGQLLAAEREEITRILVAGGKLLNELSTADGREVLRLRREAERIAAQRAGWRELAMAATDLLGGPLPPGDLPEVEIPDLTWLYMSRTDLEREERLRPLLAAVNPQNRQAEEERYRTWLTLFHAREDAARKLQSCAHRAWGVAIGKGGHQFADDLDHSISVIAGTPYKGREEVSRHLALTIWYVLAVHPWRHLAELAGLADDDEAFIAWASTDADVREGLEFLAARREGALGRLPYRWYSEFEEGPGHLLAAVAAAYSGIAPEAVRSQLAQVLEKVGDEHELTQPMSDLLLRLNPGALDSVFGPDVAAKIDCELGLDLGMAGRVLRALGEHITHINDPQVRRAIDRSTQGFPVTALPDYRQWSGPAVLAARVISASLVQAGLAAPEYTSANEYLAEVSNLWLLRQEARRQAV
jgi:hypothetical protein